MILYDIILVPLCGERYIRPSEFYDDKSRQSTAVAHSRDCCFLFSKTQCRTKELFGVWKSNRGVLLLKKLASISYYCCYLI